MTTRKFYKTIIPIEVISEEPIPDGMNVSAIIEEATTGDYSMRMLPNKEKVLNGKQAVKVLEIQGSDPSFFNLTSVGNDLV